MNVICNTKETLKQIEIIRFSKNNLASLTSFIVTSPPKLTDCRKQSLFYALYSIFCDRSSTFMITNQISYQAEMISEGHLFSCLLRFVRFLIKEVKVLKLTLPSFFLIQKKLNQLLAGTKLKAKSRGKIFLENTEDCQYSRNARKK